MAKKSLFGLEPAGPLDYLRKWPLLTIMALTFIFLYVPLLTLMAFSFNNSRRNIVWNGFSLKYYEKLFQNDDLMIAFGNSLTIAFVSTIISLILGAMVAILLWRFRFSFKPVYEGAMALPIVFPKSVWGSRCWPFSRGSAGPMTFPGRSA